MARKTIVLLALIVAGTMPAAAAPPAAANQDVVIAESLAQLLLAGETVISREQDRINNPELGDKGLSGSAVLKQALRIYPAMNGVDPASRQGRLLRAQMDAIV